MVKKVFSASPLSSNMLDQLTSKYGCDFEQTTLSFIKNLGIFSSIKFLRTVSDMNVVFEDKESEKLLDIFLLLFLVTKSKKIILLRDDLTTFTLNRKDAVFSVIKTFWGTCYAFYSALKIFAISKCIKEKTNFFVDQNLKEVFYLKTNYWFGVKAGGSVAHMEGVISGLKAKGFQIDFAAVEAPKSFKTSIQEHFLLNIPRYLSPIFSLNLLLFDNIQFKTLKKRTFKKYKFIYHRMALNSLAAIRLSHHLKVPLILEYNGSEVWVQRNWGKQLFLEQISQAIENASLRCANYIVTVSDVLKQELIQRGIPEKKIICYPNCVDSEKFNPTLFTKEHIVNKRKLLGFTEDDIILTFIGTFGKWHGVECLARAIRSLYEKEYKWLKNKNIKFLLIGDGPCMPEVKQILSSIPNYSSFVKLPGLVVQEEAPLYLALSDVLLSPHCLPNNSELFFGSPTKLFEYMAMNKIIIASDLGQIGETLSPSVHVRHISEINSSTTAILCSPGKEEDIFEAIRYACNNLTKIKFMGTNARSKVVKNYTWKRHVEEIINQIQPFHHV